MICFFVSVSLPSNIFIYSQILHIYELLHGILFFFFFLFFRYLHRIHFNMHPRLADAIGLKHMFDGFGSRKKVEPDDKEVRNMRRRQSFIDSTGNDGEEGDDDDDNDEGVSLGLSFDGPKKSMHSLLFGGQKKTLYELVHWNSFFFLFLFFVMSFF